MQHDIVLLSGIAISCFVITMIIFQLIESRQIRAFENEKIYIGVKIAVSIFLMMVNLLRQPMLNMLSWIAVFGLVGLLLYYDVDQKPVQRVLEIEVMVLVFIVCETIGIILFEFIFWNMHIPQPEPNIKTFLSMMFSMLVILFLYYVVISRIWGKKEKVRFTRAQYILHFMIAAYSFVNLIVIGFLAGSIKSEGESFMLLMNMGFIVFVDMYFLYFTQFLEENNQLKIRLKLLEQQTSMQYKYYVEQEKKYKQSLHILHDVDKHLTAIEGLYSGKNQEEAIGYTKEIGKILKPLIPKQRTNQPILNILLNDKMQIAEKSNIDLQYDIEQVDLDFMNPMDITTIFGNLLDNAIEACEKVEGFRQIRLKISLYYEMVAISIENTTSDDCQWKNNRPVSQKGLNHGIGLSNIEKALHRYDGSMQLSCSDGKFLCKIIIIM